MAFYVGQKVVYLGTGTIGNNIIASARSPKRDQICTIREIDPIYIPFHGCPGIRVEEVVNESVRWSGILIEPCRTSDNFRPVVERKTDISIFTAMLTPSTERVQA